MPVGWAALLFPAGALTSLGASWLLVSRLERVGDRMAMSEVLIGLVAATAADAPEVTSAVTALLEGQHAVGAGVVLGSNVFNLAALLGLTTIVSGGILLHRKVVVLNGCVAVWVALVCVLVVVGALPALLGVALTLAILAPFVVVLAAGGQGLRRMSGPRRRIGWLAKAVSQERQELTGTPAERRGKLLDGIVALAALLVVVGASVAMERSVSIIGRQCAVPDIIIGGLVLAAVTSLPNAVSAIHLATRGRGSAAMSTAMASNTINVLAGLLIPGAVAGLGATTGQAVFVAAWYAGLTGFALAFAYKDGELRPDTGWLIVAAYLCFTGALIAGVHGSGVGPGTTLVPPLAMMCITGVALIARRRRSRVRR